MRRAVLLGCLLTLGAAAVADAVDLPVSARKLILRRTAGGEEKLSFLTKDANFPFPAIGSDDDPMMGTPGGVTIELFSPEQGAVRIDVPAAVGWIAKDGSPAFYKFTNKLAPGGVSAVSSLLVKEERAIRLRSSSVGFPSMAPLGPVGIRITMGTLRVCALFDATTIKRDEARVFLARDAKAASLADCSTASLGGPTCGELADAPICGGTCPAGSACGSRDLSTCECIAAAQPCGDTAPVCNGECPAGQECGTTGGLPFPGCACLPTGSTPCGNELSPTCGGDCPSGLDCYGVTFPFGPFTANGCQCLAEPPTDPCGGCLPGFQCIVGPGLGPICLAFCNGASGPPTCGGPCPAGLSCGVVSGTCLCQP